MKPVYRMRKIMIQQAGREDFPAQLIQHIRNIDPVIWPGLLGVYKLMQLNDQKQPTENIGVILCGKSYPQQSSRQVLDSLSTKGRVSPFDFTTANAAASISMICSTFHFHGPSINLCLPVMEAIETLELIIQHWLNQNIHSMFVIKQDDQVCAEVEHIFIDKLTANNPENEVLSKESTHEDE